MRSFIPAIIMVVLLSAGCSQSLYTKGKIASREGDYDEAITTLYRAVEEDPEDYRAWREIGIAYYRNALPDKAEEAFAMSNRIKPNAGSSLYLGLIFEKREEYDKAIKLYGSAINLEGNNEVREDIRNRLDILIDRKLEQEAIAAVDNESGIDTRSIPENTIAVINFDNSALEEDMKPLAMGLAELTATDLAKVSELNVVERAKINAILKELKLSQSQYADPHNAPRVGRLMGSRKLVTGMITGAGEEAFRIDGALVNTVEGKTSRTGAAEGELKKFFRVQKKFVFDVIDTLGMELTREERDAIEEVPTESFLAFMAYSRGLMYQQQGMPGEALKHFRDAQQHDPGFGRAAGMAAKMELKLSMGGGGEGEKFEKLIQTSVISEEAGAGLANVQAANLINNGFIRTPGSRFGFGVNPLAPPGGGAISTGYGFIIIEGNLDADK